jgi:hypothetical protein
LKGSKTNNKIQINQEKSKWNLIYNEL